MSHESKGYQTIHISSDYFLRFTTHFTTITTLFDINSTIGSKAMSGGIERVGKGSTVRDRVGDRQSAEEVVFWCPHNE